MRIYIDNLDGTGLQEYTQYASTTTPATIERKLNAPSVFTASLLLADATLAAPVEHAYIKVTNDAYIVLFTGYITSAPVAFDNTITFNATSEEWLLNEVGDNVNVRALGGTVGEVLQKLTTRQSAQTLDASNVTPATSLGVFSSNDESFSSTAGEAAASANAAYKVLSGKLSIAPIASQTHALNIATDVVSLKYATRKLRANDITVSGAMEPATYRTDVFTGDGTTSSFILAAQPYGTAVTSLVEDTFSNATFGTQTWGVADPGAYLSLTANGLAISGGNGYDGQTRISLQDEIELGGTLVAEAAGVTLNIANDGVLCGFFNGPVLISNCIAGIRIRQSSGNIIAVGLLNGVEAGTPQLLTAGHAYTFRVRVHAAEMYRVPQTYYARSSGVQQSFGGGITDSPLHIVCEMRDEGLASSTAITVLCDATLSTSPAVCTFAAMDDVHLVGSIRSIALRQSGPTWVTRRAADGTERSALLGVNGEGVDCSLTSTGVLSFFDGRVPAPGEKIIVTYRTAARACARLQNTEQVLGVASMGLPGVARWKGRVTSPVARTSADCEAAAAALLSEAIDADAALSGACDVVNPTTDIWPGDALNITAPDGTKQLLVHNVRIVDEHAQPEAMRYEMHLANEWDAGISIQTEQALASNADDSIIRTAANAPLNNLPSLKVVSVSAASIEIDAGQDAPTGGGFEVRRRDAGFGTSVDSDLVLRSTGRDFVIPRASQVESYAVRMYDGSTPRRYSRFSSVVTVSAPMG